MVSDNGTVLIVDDDAINTELLAEYLESRGYEVTTASDGFKAIESIAGHMPDAVLLDVMMPRMDGLEACMRIKAEPKSSALPVLMITALDGSEDRKKAMAAGADDFISKPFDFAEVSLRVRNAVRMRRQFVQVSESYERLREMEALRDTLTHSILHDVRSPLSGALSIVTTLNQTMAKAINERHAQMLGRVRYSLRMTLEMLASILDVARIESGAFPLTYSRCDVRDLVDQAVSITGTHGQDTVVQVDMPETGCMVDCDAAVIGRVIVNLLDNALKHAQSRGIVSVAMKRTAGEIVLGVADNGPGIPLDMQEKIFEKFATGSSISYAGKHSTGLGLTFCKLAVEAHQGKIGVDSELGNGSRFWFVIPVSRPVEEERAA